MSHVAYLIWRTNYSGIGLSLTVIVLSNVSTLD